MEVTYRRDREHNYMILKAPDDMQGNEYQVRMLLVNEIPGLLRCRLRNIDGVSYFYYEITSRQPLARLFEHRAAGYDDIRALIFAIGRTMEGIARYLLTEDELVLEPELIYMDVETKEVSFCYLPFCREDFTESFRGLAEYLLKNLDHEDEQAVLWGYQLYSRTIEDNYSVSAVIQNLRGKLEKGREKRREEKAAPKAEIEKAAAKQPQNICKNEEKDKLPVRKMMTGQEHLKRKKERKKIAGLISAVFLYTAGLAALVVFRILTLTQVGGLLFLAAGAFYYLCMGRKEKRGKEKEEKKRKRDVWRKRGEKAGKKQDRKERMQEDCEMPEEMGVQKDAPEEEICDFQEEPGEEIYGQTTLLGGSVTGEHPVLISSNPDVRENVVIDKEKFMIGKLKGQVDMTLNLPVISRMHAGIERRDGGYFLVDLNSTNGTYLNGERLEANEYRRIHTGDEIVFAGAGYYFKE